MAKKGYIEWEKIARVGGETISGSAMMVIVAIVDVALHKALVWGEKHEWIEGIPVWLFEIALDVTLFFDLLWLVVYIVLQGYRLLKENTRHEEPQNGSDDEDDREA